MSYYLGAWNLNPGPLQERQVFLNMEQSPQSLLVRFKVGSYHQVQGRLQGTILLLHPHECEDNRRAHCICFQHYPRYGGGYVFVNRTGLDNSTNSDESESWEGGKPRERVFSTVLPSFSI